MSNIRYAVLEERFAQTPVRCLCTVPIWEKQATWPPREAGEDKEEAIPLAPALDLQLQAALRDHFPRTATFSLLLLHITQFAYTQTPSALMGMHTRVKCHAPASFLEQVLHATRRVLRASDLILSDPNGSGAVFLFPLVESMGMVQIMQRVFHSIDLLQAETVVPPLREQTEVVLGAASYPERATSPEELLIQASRVRERILFRPAVLPEPIPFPTRASATRSLSRRQVQTNEQEDSTEAQGVPFMQIPSRLPTRLKQLVPYSLARELRCAPVGRAHNRLTVAMANPTDAQALSHLREVTGMTIFPVACEPAALERLLASNW